MSDGDWSVATSVLRLSTELVDGIQEGLARRGFDDVRPAHGFVFALLSQGDATTADVAQHLGVTKQAASQVVQHLVDRGYVERRPDPHDARARLLVLTARGRACTRAAEAAAAETVAAWRTQVNPRSFATMSTAMRSIATPGPLRPSW